MNANTEERRVLERCIQHAQQVKYLNITQISDLLNMNKRKWSLFKWIKHGNLPLNKIVEFQDACGCDFITQYLVNSSGKLLIDCPDTHPTDIELINLQVCCTTALHDLLAFTRGKGEIEAAIYSLTDAINLMASFREELNRRGQQSD